MKLHTLKALATKQTTDDLKLPLNQMARPFTPPEVDVDGLVDPSYEGYIKYIGKARLIMDGMYQALADVGGALCIVAVRITWPSEEKKT